MANLNTGKPVDFKEITDYQQAAHDFAEGSTALEEVLLNCFQKGISTHSCCKGHDETQSRAYLSLSYTPQNKELYSLMLLALQDYDISFGYNKLANHQPFISFYHNVDKDYSESSLFFQRLNEVIKAYQSGIVYSTSLPSDLKKYMELMDLINEDEILNNKEGNNYCELSYAKEDDHYKYDIVSSDGYYEFAARKAGFKSMETTSGMQAYETSSLVREENLEPLKDICNRLKTFQPKKDSPNLSTNINEHLTLESGEEINFEFNDSREIKIPRLKVNLGDSIDLIAQKLKLCHDHGYQVNAIFNGVELSNLAPDNIVENYEESMSSRHR